MDTRALSLGVKRPGREADHSPPYQAKVKECVELYLHSPNMPSLCGASLSTGTTLPLPSLFEHQCNGVYAFLLWFCYAIYLLILSNGVRWANENV
jgi:hypothetical protein